MVGDDDRADGQLACDVLRRGHRSQAQNFGFTHRR
jgi:hypothetical protein